MVSVNHNSPFLFSKREERKVLHFRFEQNLWPKCAAEEPGSLKLTRIHANNALWDPFSPVAAGGHFLCIILVIIMVKNIITIIIKIIAILIDIIFTIICLQLLSSLVFPTRWATERRAATKQKDSKPALSDMIKVVLNMMMTMNYFGRWENYFGRLENNFGRAGGKIILAGGKIILASLVTTRPDNPIQSERAKSVNS